MATTHEPCTSTNEVWYNERSWTDLQVLFESLLPLMVLLEYGDGGVFKLLRWMKNLQKSAWNHKILYADKSSDDEQI
jgi:hypothetical protein